MLRICSVCGMEADTFSKEPTFICLPCKQKLLLEKLYGTINQIAEQMAIDDTQSWVNDILNFEPVITEPAETESFNSETTESQDEILPERNRRRKHAKSKFDIQE